MKIENYLDLYTSSIKTLIDTNPTDFTEVSLKQALIKAVNQLKPYRLDDSQTRNTITNILKEYQRPVRDFDGSIYYYEDSVDSNVFSHMLLKYCKREESFYYAYLRLQQAVNCRIAIPEDIIFKSEQEIEDAVLADMRLDKANANSKQETFASLLIHSKKEELLKLLHEVLNYKKGKDVVVVIKAMEKLQLLKPYRSIASLHSLITKEFGDIGGLKNFSNYMNGTTGYQLLESDIEKYLEVIG